MAQNSLWAFAGEAVALERPRECRSVGEVAPHDDKARKAFERVCRTALPTTHKQLQRAIVREAREHAKRQDELPRAGRR